MVLEWIDVVEWIDVINNVQPCQCSANGIQRRSNVVMLSGYRMMLGMEVMMPLDLMLGSDREEAGRGGTFRADFKDGWVEAH